MSRIESMATEQQSVKQDLLMFGFDTESIDRAFEKHTWITGDKQRNLEALADIILQAQSSQSVQSSIPPDIETIAAIDRTKQQTTDQFYFKMIKLLNNGKISYGHSTKQIRKIMVKEYNFDPNELKTNKHFEDAIERIIELMMDEPQQNEEESDDDDDDDAPLIWLHDNNKQSKTQKKTISDQEYAQMLQAQFDDEQYGECDEWKYAEQPTPFYEKYRLPKDAMIGPFNSITAIKHGRRCYLIRDESKNYNHFDASQLKWTPHPPQTAQSWTSQYFGNDFALIPKMKKCLRQQIEQRNGMGQYYDHEYSTF